MRSKLESVANLQHPRIRKKKIKIQNNFNKFATLECESLRDKYMYRKKEEKNFNLSFRKTKNIFVPLNSVACRATPRHSECCKGKEATPTDVRLLERRSRRTGSLLPPMFSYTTRDSKKGSRKETLKDKCENNYDSLSIVQYRESFLKPVAAFY